MSQLPARLAEGYAAFREGRLARERERYQTLAETGQRPDIMVIGCCDSRVAPEVIFDVAPGEIFVLRNVANLVPPYAPDSQYHGTSAAIEFAVLGLGVRHIVVMGHGRCGGIKALREKIADLGGGSDFIGRWMSILEVPGGEVPGQEELELAAIRQSLANLEGFPFVRDRQRLGLVTVHGLWFDVASGELRYLDKDADEFKPVA